MIVLEANTGFLHLYKLLQAAGGRERVPAEGAHNALKDVVAQRWAQDGCEVRAARSQSISLGTIWNSLHFLLCRLSKTG